MPKKRKLKLVIDTNLLVAAVFNKQSASARILQKALEEEVIIMWSEETLQEALFILDRVKAKEEFVEQLKDVFLKTRRIKDIPHVDAVKSDPSDNKFLATALAGQADLIVSNDSDLRELEEFEEIPIVSSVEAVNMFKLLEKGKI